MSKKEDSKRTIRVHNPLLIEYLSLMSEHFDEFGITDLKPVMEYIESTGETLTINRVLNYLYEMYVHLDSDECSRLAILVVAGVRMTQLHELYKQMIGVVVSDISDGCMQKHLNGVFSVLDLHSRLIVIMVEEGTYKFLSEHKFLDIFGGSI